MRIFLTTLFIVVATGSIVYFFAPETYSCVQPIRYSIGNLDERFGLSEDEFLLALETAEAVWESEVDKELFVYDEKGRFKVNLVYDERQLRTELAEASEGVLDQKEAEYQAADNVYRENVTQLEAAIADFNERVAKFEEDRERYMRRVRAWNRSSRTDTAELEALREEEEVIRGVQNELRARESEIKEMQEAMEESMRERNRLARDYNIDVADFNRRFGTGEAFDQGTYSRGRINIYQFSSAEDLALVLAHEFGHALGIGHVDDPEAVMYYLMGDQAKDPISLSPADRTALAMRCTFF